MRLVLWSNCQILTRLLRSAGNPISGATNLPPVTLSMARYGEFPGVGHVCYSRKFLPVIVVDAEVAELADALASGASESNLIGVQIPASAPAFAHLPA